MTDIMIIKITCIRNGQSIKYARSMDTVQYTTEELLRIIAAINRTFEGAEDNNGRA
jgi:hypothetical protein